MGTHQKIDRLARQHIGRLIPYGNFPSARSILHFEGHNGPDAIKRKSPAKDEPWHYLQPFDASDTQLIELIESHYRQLVKALKESDDVRASFEAAWLAHAVVDGLTPAHHYPYEEKLVELANGQDITERTTLAKKIFLPGESPSERLKSNWKMWGPKGLFTTHAAFEVGVAMLVAPLRLRRALVTKDKLAEFEAVPLAQWFRNLAQDVARLELYDAFYESGWTIPLARRIRRQLAPTLVQAVAVMWYGAAREAGRTF
ncbi:MAG TPA: hypothetical protein VG604_04635 [Candidatus Saccharimonadales bacterium]|nr:hypothetical protein [Candidatus Saccharimonadales bacterium]